MDIAGLASGHANPAAVAVHLAGAAFAFLYHTYTLRVLNWLPGGRGSGQDGPPRAAAQAPRAAGEAAAGAGRGRVGGRGGRGSAVGRVAGVDEHLEAKLDEVLAKVAKHGKESLTEAEREILLKASEIYKKRRRPG